MLYSYSFLVILALWFFSQSLPSCEPELIILYSKDKNPALYDHILYTGSHFSSKLHILIWILSNFLSTYVLQHSGYCRQAGLRRSEV